MALTIIFTRALLVSSIITIFRSVTLLLTHWRKSRRRPPWARMGPCKGLERKALQYM